MIKQNEVASELLTLIAGEFLPVVSNQAIDDLKRLPLMMGQDASVLNDLCSWVDLIGVIEQNPDLDSKLAFLEGDSWRAFLPAWMSICLEQRISKSRHDGLAAITVGSIQRPAENDPTKRKIFEARVSGLTKSQRRVVGKWGMWMAKLPLFADDPNLSARIDEAWGVTVNRI